MIKYRFIFSEGKIRFERILRYYQLQEDIRVDQATRDFSIKAIDILVMWSFEEIGMMTIHEITDSLHRDHKQVTFQRVRKSLIKLLKLGLIE